MQENIGRESRKDNDLFFTCSLIDYIARKTKNTRQETVDALGRERIAKFMIWQMFITAIISNG